MISPISIATRGRISTSTKKTLTLAVIGWLVFSSNEVIPNPAPIPILATQDGSVKRVKKEDNESSGANIIRRKRLIENDDEEFLSIIKMWLRCR